MRARALTLTLLVIMAAALLVDLIQAAPALGVAWNLGLREFLGAAQDVADRPVPAALLLPARILVRPTLAQSWAEWAPAMLPAMAILIAHYIWVVRSDAAFEETAAAAALARQRAGRRAGRTPRFTARPIPPLAPAGRPAAALLWKNLASVVRTGRARGTVVGFGAAALAVVVLAAGEGSTPLLEIVGWMTAMWSGFLLLLGPQWVRNDLRTDLSRLALLRSYPLRGATVVGAETAASTAVLTALQLGLIVIAYLAFWAGDVPDPSFELRTAVLAAALVFLPAINFLAMLIQNGAALLLPGWARVGTDRPVGIEALGHNMLVMSAFVAILGGLLLAPAGVGWAVFLGLMRGWGWWAVVPAAGGALLVLGLEAWLLLFRLGRVFEGTDPSVVPPVESV